MKDPSGFKGLLRQRYTGLELRNESVSDGTSDDGVASLCIHCTRNTRHFLLFGTECCQPKWKDSVPTRQGTIHRGANMTEHCEKLSRQRSRDIFGTQQYPICYTDDRQTIKHIHCVIGHMSKYQNVVNADSIYYCYGSDGAHVSMRRAFAKQTVFPVKVTANGTPETYLWGYAVIHALLEMPVDEVVGKSTTMSLGPMFISPMQSRPPCHVVRGRPPPHLPTQLPHTSSRPLRSNCPCGCGVSRHA